MPNLDFITRPIDIKDPPDFTVVSTFAGCGGSSTGYVWAGGKVLLAVEWDDNAVETYRLNYPETTIYHGDIANLSVDEALSLSGVQPYELDIFDGSPPCQGFSTAGKRNLDDPRNQLFREYVRLLKGFMPKVFVMENVSGLVKGKMKLVFADMLRELKACGYRVSAKLLNAMYLGVPQSRQRVIFIGVRDDLGIEPSHPKPQTKPITVREALDTLDISLSTTLEEARHLKQYKVSKWIEQCNPGESAKKYHPKGFFFNAIRLPINKSAPTIAKIGGRGQACLSHYSEIRYLVVEELKRLGSFPDCYLLVGTLENAYNRIGNSVPPEMMRRIALHIKTHILSNIAHFESLKNGE